MKVCFVFHSFASASGIANVVLNLANEFSKNDAEVSIITFAADPHQLHFNDKIKIWELPVFKKGSSFLYTRDGFKSLGFLFLKKTLKEIRPDIVSLHYPPLDDMALKLKELFRYKTVYHYYSVANPELYSGDERKRRLKEEDALYKNLTKADLIISISKFVQKQLKAQASLDSVVVTPGVNINVFSPGESSLEVKHPALLYVGRMVQHKGVHFLAGAFNEIVKEVPGANLYLIGKYKNDAYYAAIKKEASKNGNVHFVGEVSLKELIGYYRASDVFVSASQHEGFGLPFLEAQACGVPCVALQAGSIPEVVQEQKTGYLVKEKDSRRMAEAVIHLLKDEERMKEYKANARLFAEQFNWEQKGRKTLEEYKKIL